MIISQNIPAMRTHVGMVRADRRSSNSMQRLSTGIRINTARDDAAGMSIANSFRREVQGLANASQNALDGASLIQTVDGALNEVHATLERIRQLAVQGASDTISDADRIAFQDEIEQLLDEIENIGRNTQFNGRAVFAGQFTQVAQNGSPEVIHGRITVRTNTRKDNLLHMDIPRLSIADNNNPLQDPALFGTVTGAVYDAEGNPKGTPVFDNAGNPTGAYRLTLAQAFHRDHGGSVWTHDDNGDRAGNGEWLSRSLDILDQSIRQVSDMRSRMGAYQNRLEQTSEVLDNTGINMQAALSRVIDTDMALEMADFHRHNVVSQAAISVMGMANQRPQQMLALLNF